MNLLIVEDDQSVARLLRQAAAEAGYSVQYTADGSEALARCRRLSFDLILLDVMLPGMNGLQVCRALRDENIQVPVLIITARDTLEEKVDGLDAGADDYIVKPFQIAELLARMRAILRRSTTQNTALQVHDLHLDPSTRQAVRGEKSIHLSATEFVLLEYLMRNAGRVLTRDMILQHVWQYDFNGNDNVLDVYMSYLRSKIDKGFAMPLIKTVRGVGYRLEGPDAR